MGINAKITLYKVANIFMYKTDKNSYSING